MQDNMVRFFKSIEYLDENGDFSNAIISKVVLNKKKDIFEVYINAKTPINPVETLKLIECAKKGINGKNKCHINFIYDDMNDEDILNAFKVLLGELIIKRPSLVSLENKNADMRGLHKLK